MTEEERKNFVPPRPSSVGAGGDEVVSGTGRGEKQTAQRNDQDKSAADPGRDAGETKVDEKTTGIPEPKQDEAAPAPPAPEKPAAEPAPKEETKPEPPTNSAGGGQ